MKILHICLCGPVTDGWSYQDNLLPKYHKKLGYDTVIITSTWIWNASGKLEKISPSTYINENGVKVIRKDFEHNKSVQHKFKRLKSLYKDICDENPDILFVHGVQFIDIKEIVRFRKYNPRVKLFIDNHADFSNSATNWISKNILHKVVWRYFAQKAEPYTERFWGVLPARVDFLVNVYGLPKEKCDLLVMGADDECVNTARFPRIKKEIRRQYHIRDNDFLIMTGGKIDEAKRQTLLLMDAVKNINQDNVKLIVFGSVAPKLEEEVKKRCDNFNVQYIGWIQGDESYNLFAASDLVVFPGRHSVYWEQVAGLGVPLLVKYWEGTTHIDVGGNCKFVYEDSISNIESTLNSVVNNKEVYGEMTRIASGKGANCFSYERIAKKSVGINKGNTI